MSKGWKVFDRDLKCRGFQYEIGKSYKHEGKIELCGSGFHFHTKPSDLFNYYDFNSNNRVCEIEYKEEITVHGDDKSVTNELLIKKELNWYEVLELINTGKNCSGRNNSGNWNSGNRNSGSSNSGNRNSGNWNSGNWNSGDGNSGDRNSSDRNSGNRNSGSSNSGNWNSGNRNSGSSNSGSSNSGNRNSGNRNSGSSNSGNWNSGSSNSGNLNTQKHFFIFDLPFENYQNIEYPDFFFFNLCEWIELEKMTEQEKLENVGCEFTYGYLKKKEYKQAWRESWGGTTKEDKIKCFSLPNWNNEKFLKISGINVEKELGIKK